MGSRKRERLKQRRCSVNPLRVAIVTAPSSGASGISLTRDVELVKASALYADEIELVSLAAVMVAGTAQLAKGGDQAMLGLLSALDDDTLRHLGGGKQMPENWRDILTALSRPEARDDPATAEMARAWQATVADAQADLARTVDDLLVDSGAEELLPAFGSGLVTLSDAGFTEEAAGDTDALMNNWLALLRGLLVDTKTRLVLDDEVGSLAASLISEGRVNPHSLTIRHAGQAAVGSGLVARLPAFPAAPLDEILDLRDDLAVPLGRYRSAVVRLSDRLQAGPFAKDLPDEIDDLWGTDVQPALDQIGDGLHDHGLVREIARSARQDVKTLIAEGSALYVGLAGLASVNEWIAATAGLAGAAVGAAAAGAHRASAGRKDLAGRDLFYLYEVDRRLPG